MQKSFVMRALLMFVVIALSLILLQAGSVSSALGSGQDWIIEGDCVYWNNTKGDVRVCPHTLQGSGWAYFNVTSHLPASFNLDFAFGITENIVVSKPQIWANFSHPVLVSNCTVSQVQIVNNGTPGTENRTTCNPYYAQNFYPDWQNVGSFSTTQYDGKTWYARSATWDANETKSGRVWLDVKRMSGRSKYSVFLKKVSDTFAQAEANGNYVLLDPWVDSPPSVFNETFDTGAFINGTWGNLNVSRGWLILNITGTNATVVTRNASDDGVARTCRNSSQDGSYIGSLTNYPCSNVFDGVIATGGSPANAWSGNTFTEPEWIIKDLPSALWMYNFSIYTEYASSTWGAGNWSMQCSDTAINTLSASTATPGGSDSVGNWNYATFNVTTAAEPPTSQYVTLGQVRCRSFRFNYLNLWNPATNAMWLAEIEGQQATFNTSGQKMSILLNDTVTVQEVNVTCINTSGNSNEVGFNVTVMDKDYANEQTVQCGVAENGTGFRNDITDITGLIYRINMSSSSSGVTPELDYLTFRLKASAPAVVVLPSVNVSIINRTSSNASVILASEHVWSNANYSHASNLPEENSTFKWFTNDTVNGVRTAELIPMIYKGAVGYWHLDSVNGSNVTFDSSGGGNNGNLFGFNQSNATTAGIINSGFRFDGKDDYVISGDMNLNWSGSNFTAVLWADMLSPAGAVGGMVSNRDGEVGNGRWWTLGWYEYDVRGEIQMEIGNGTTQTYIRSGIYPKNKGWQHYALTKSGLTWTLYYNGVLNKTTTTAATYGDIGASTNDFIIGRWSGNTQVWNGSIDEVAIYNRSLSASEIKQLYLRTWYDVSPEVLLAHMDNASNNLVNATLMGSHHPPATQLAGGVNCTAEVAGVYGQACKFDGVNDYVNVSRNPILNFGKGDYSVEFWLNWTGSSSANAIMGKRETGNWWRAYITAEGILTIEQENNNADLETTFQINKWYYVAIVRNVAAGTSYLYINGVQNDTATATGLDVSNNGDFLIGKYSTTFFNGTIDEVRLSRKALTAQEINESFSKGRAFFQNEYLLNSSNYAADDVLKLEYIPGDSAGAVGVAQNSSSLNVHAPKIADESEGDVAIEAGINSSLPSATKYSSQQVYVRNLSNNQTLGRFDWVAASGSQRWLINYITTGESYVSAPNLTTAVYVLEIADKTSAQITDEVSRLINATKS